MSGCVGPGQQPGTQCGREVRARGLCNTHCEQQRKNPDRPLRPIGEPRNRADAETERLIRDEYRKLVESGYQPKQTRAAKKECPRGNDPDGDLRCSGVAIAGVKVIDPHDAPAEQFGHNGRFCREGRSRCRQRQCRACMSVRGNLRAAVQRARFAGMTDDEIRAAKPEKRCGRCRRVFTSEQFPVNRTESDGLHSRCRQCNSEGVKRTILPETHRAAVARRRARKRQTQTEKFTHDEMIAHWISLGIDPETCWFCGIRPFEDTEHFIPLALGGGHTLDNVLPSCRRCNRGPGGKHAKNPILWMEKLVDDGRTEIEIMPDSSVEVRFWRKPPEEIRKEFA